MHEPDRYAVLVIEDDPASFALIDRVLSKDGYTVLPARNREEALGVIRCTTPDVILLDLLLPDVYGIELIDEMKHLTSLKLTPVIIISSIDDVNTKVEGLDTGAVDYLTKPLDADELRARLRVAIRKADYEKSLNKSLDSAYRDSITDTLTGLYNRRYLDDHLAREFSGARRYGRNFSLLVIDVDDFKKVNDVFGHVVGDCVLGRIGMILKGFTRPSDLSARFGGEEFVVYLSDTPEENAIAAAEKLRAEVERCRFKEMTGQDVTVSIGVAQYRDSDVAVEDIINRGDQALYAAKRAGKNRVVGYSAL